MLVLAMGLLTTGGVLMYSGLKKGDYWKKPWQPVVDLFTQGQLRAFFATGAANTAERAAGIGANQADIAALQAACIAGDQQACANLAALSDIAKGVRAATG